MVPLLLLVQENTMSSCLQANGHQVIQVAEEMIGLSSFNCDIVSSLSDDPSHLTDHFLFLGRMRSPPVLVQYWELMCPTVLQACYHLPLSLRRA